MLCWFDHPQRRSGPYEKGIYPSLIRLKRNAHRARWMVRVVVQKSSVAAVRVSLHVEAHPLNQKPILVMGVT